MTPLFRTAALLMALVTSGEVAAQTAEGIPAQRFALDPAHGIVVFSVDHLGLSQFVAGFDRVDAQLDLDPSDPASARLTVRIEVASLDLPAPPPGFLEDMLGPTWFDAATHPEIIYVADTVTLTEEDTARIDGTLTLLGASAPLTLQARFNGAYPAGFLEPHPRLGFSAETRFSRSAFGMTAGVPAPGTRMGVGDEVTVRIEAEFIGTGAASP